MKVFNDHNRIVYMVNKDEAEIVRSILSGKIGYYALFVDRYQTGLIIHCENLTQDRAHSEDLAQEAFIKAFHNLERFDSSRAHFSTWLYKIATNLCLDYLRSTQKQVDIEDIEAIAGVTMPTHIEDDIKEHVRFVVANLKPNKFSKVIEGYYWHGKSYQQLAREMNVPENTIATWIKRAKQQLRKELAL